MVNKYRWFKDDFMWYRNTYFLLCSFLHLCVLMAILYFWQMIFLFILSGKKLTLKIDLHSFFIKNSYPVSCFEVLE